MVRRTYVSLGDPKDAVRAFSSLAPYATELRRLQASCKPFGRDYHAMAIALDGLESAAYHFTRWPNFFSARGDAAGLGAPRPRAPKERGRACTVGGTTVRYLPSVLAHRP